MSEPIKINPANRYAVGTNGSTVRVLIPPRELLPDEALIFAAWLVVLAEHSASFTFEEARKAVEVVMSEQATQFPDEITVSVTEKHIETGEENNCWSCPIALAVRAVLPNTLVQALYDRITVQISSRTVQYEMPAVAGEFMDRFDFSETVGPFTFTTRRITQ